MTGNGKSYMIDGVHFWKNEWHKHLKQSHLSDMGAIWGYGKPTKGDYSVSDKGSWKTFGTEGQGNADAGLKQIGTPDC